jgi:hypothetical protein
MQSGLVVISYTAVFDVVVELKKLTFNKYVFLAQCRHGSVLSPLQRLETILAVDIPLLHGVWCHFVS